MLLNCDLGESYGAWKMPVDDAIMPLIDQANIACGFHAGDPIAIEQAIGLAAQHQVQIGAHPAYPDLQGFGRRSMAMAPAELSACLRYQISALQGLATLHGQPLRYVKPHGALYHDLLHSEEVRETVFAAIAAFGPLPVMVLAQAEPQTIKAHARQHDLPVLFEAFADRRYTDEGGLMSRQQSGAVLTGDEALAQARQIIDKGTVTTATGHTLALTVDTLCVHGDTPDALAMAKHIRALIGARQQD